MNINVMNRETEIVNDVRPHIHVLLVLVGAEAEASHHLKERQVRTITNFVYIVGADTILDVPVTGEIRELESGFERLHPRADEESGCIVFGDNVGVEMEGETVFVKPAAKGLG